MRLRIAILAVYALAAGATPGTTADADNGQQLAQRWCASCHVVAPDQREASADAPPFASIARMPDFNAQKVAFFLLEPHPKMPAMALSRRDSEDIAAYIAKLGR
ncbi:MAG TPA: c-type cytochrome [Xanthobacteraceae bacterium]|jgi:mono/diheme cytochrome c family protein|nr:c-type cytochrome [Xanthobacteraceae bacterium]